MAKYTVQITVEVPDEDDTFEHIESWFEEAVIEALEIDGMPSDHVEVQKA